MYNRPFVWAWVVCAAQLMDADLNIMCGTVLRMECIVRIGTSVLMRTVPYVLLRTAPYCSVLLRTAPYWYVWYSTVMVLYPGTYTCVRGELSMECGNTQDAVPDARAKRRNG